MGNCSGHAIHDKAFKVCKWQRTINNNKTCHVSLPKICQTVHQPLSKCNLVKYLPKNNHQTANISIWILFLKCVRHMKVLKLNNSLKHNLIVFCGGEGCLLTSKLNILRPCHEHSFIMIKCDFHGDVLRWGVKSWMEDLSLCHSFSL